MPESKTTCPECGAVVPAGAEQCVLCGTEVPAEEAAAGGEADGTVAPASASSGADAAAPSAEEGDGASNEGVFCNQCGWQNPPGAHFCSRCGHELQPEARAELTPPGTKSAAGPPEAHSGGTAARSQRSLQSEEEHEATTTPSGAADDGLAQRVAWVVGGAAVLIVGLYGLSAWSGSASTSGGESSGAGSGGPPPAMAGGGGGAAGGGRGGASDGSAVADGEVPEIIRRQQGRGVPAAIATRADSLQRAVEQRSGEPKQQARRELARLFAAADSTNRAAAQQWQLARQTDATPDWERAGSLLYDWMAALDRGRKRTEVARLAVDAYQRVLRDQPDNYDVRTNLAVAYLDTNNPMRGISEIKRVLDEVPDHVGARFNYGLMQAMIGRNATALEQFERVRETASEGSRYYEQAGRIIQRINENAGEDGPQDAPMPGQDGGRGGGGGSPSVGMPGS